MCGAVSFNILLDGRLFVVILFKTIFTVRQLLFYKVGMFLIWD